MGNQNDINMFNERSVSLLPALPAFCKFYRILRRDCSWKMLFLKCYHYWECCKTQDPNPSQNNVGKHTNVCLPTLGEMARTFHQQNLTIKLPFQYISISLYIYIHHIYLLIFPLKYYIKEWAHTTSECFTVISVTSTHTQYCYLSSRKHWNTQSKCRTKRLIKIQTHIA